MSCGVLIANGKISWLLSNYIKLKLFAVLFSIDNVVPVKTNIFTETMVSIDNKAANNSSLKIKINK